MEDIAVITEGHGTGSGLTLQANYHRLLDLCLKLWMHHFEFLNLGYAAYLDFFGFCKQAFPNIPDQAIAKMVAGVDVDLFRPDDELKKLARLAVELDVDDVLADADRPDEVDERMKRVRGGQALARRRGTRPASRGSTSPRARASTTRTRSGSSTGTSRSASSATTRPRCARATISPGRSSRSAPSGTGSSPSTPSCWAPTRTGKAFEEKIGLARVVFPYVENHNFYVEHWAHSMVWRKMRELGRVFVKEGFIADENDVFYWRRNEIPDVIWDLYQGWAVGAPAARPEVLGRGAAAAQAAS